MNAIEEAVVTVARDYLDRAYLNPIVAELAEALAQPELQEFYDSLWS